MDVTEQFLIDGKYAFKELVDINRLREMLEAFSLATGFTTGLVSHPDQELLISTGWRDICTKFHRAVPASAAFCKQSNKEHSEHLKNNCDMSIRHCANGLIDGITPIIIRDVHIANLSTGQIFFEKPDLAWFRKQGESFGYDTEAYLLALSQVPVVTEQSFRKVLEFLSQMAVMLAEQGLQNLLIHKTIHDAQKNEFFLRESQTVAHLGSYILDLNTGIWDSSAVLDEIFGIDSSFPHTIDNWSLLMHPDWRKVMLDYFQNYVLGRLGRFDKEYKIIRRNDGSERWIHGLGKLELDAQQRPITMIGTIQDITDRKLAEAEFQKIQKLTSIGTLAGGIAHDFNNILMGLFGNISLAKNELTKPHPALLPLENAEKSMSRAISLSKQLLTFSKGGDPIKENVSLDTLVEETARFDLSGSNIMLLFTHPSTLWLAQADKGQIQQVISNLTTNAREAMPQGGHLHITLENATLQNGTCPALPPGKYIKITVRDEGIGIDPKSIDRIFDPYFTTKHAGSGLGLTTTYSIIAKHGGHITVASELGHGTTFTLYLPASELPPPAPPPSPASVPRSKSLKILVLDDEEFIRMVIPRWLKRQGHVVESVSDGSQAIDLYQNALNSGVPYDVAILDLTIPGGMGGLEVIKSILALNPAAKSIVSSGYAEGAVMSNYNTFGFAGVIAKPYTETQLLEILERVLQ